MKKIIPTFILAAICSTSFAQLQVNSQGNVHVGDSTLYGSSCKFEISTSDGIQAVGMSILSEKCGVMIENNNNSTLNEGLRIINNLKKNTKVCGLSVKANQDTVRTAQYMGVWSTGARTSGVSAGVMGTLVSASQQPTGMTGAGIYGTSALQYIPVGVDGIYAGYFSGDVKVTGTLYGTLLTPSSSPSGGSQGSVVSANTDRTGESVSEKLGQVQLLQFLRPTKEEIQARQAAEIDKSDLLSDEQTEGLSDEEIQELRKEIEASKEPVPQTELAATRYGLAADQLKAVYPELVYEDEQGNVSINYIEMIPLLVQALNEQQAKLNEQQARIDALEGSGDTAKKAKGNATNVETEEADILSMAQNVPNPFSESTEIELNIPASVQTAAVFFYDMTGKQIDKRIITERGATTLSVSGTDLTEGMYLYSLIADGKVTSTKKMILTK